MMIDAIKLLQQGFEQLNYAYTPEQSQQLYAYAQLLIKWNKVYSLTAITEMKAIVREHLLDAVTTLPYFAAAPTILDVGSGMGVPGIVLAIMLPHRHITMIDSNAKKSAFLRQVQIELGLTNVTILQMRVEELNAEQQFACITARAFANLDLLVQLTQHLLAENGVYLALKSELGLSECKQLPRAYTAEVIQLKVPFMAAQRFLIKMLKHEKHICPG